MNPRLVALCDYVLAYPGRRLTSTHLAWVCFHSDFEVYRQRGESITGTTWCKGHDIPFPQGSDEDWARRFLMSRQPWWARAAGWLLAFAVAGRAIRG